MTVMSRAVDIWPDWVSPCAFLNWVRVMPSAAAVRVILLAKAASDPEIASPIAAAASFADLAAAARIR